MAQTWDELRGSPVWRVVPVEAFETIRQEYYSGSASAATLAERYGVREVAIYNILSGQTTGAAFSQQNYNYHPHIVGMPCPLVTADYEAIATLPCVTNAQAAIDRRTFLETRDAVLSDLIHATTPDALAEYERQARLWREGAMGHASEVAA